MNLSEGYKLPSSQFAAFHITFTGGPATFDAQPLVTGAAIVGDSIVAQLGRETYNPFELYGVTPGRDQPMAPHQLFANLPESPEAAAAFVAAYGPLVAPTAVDLPQYDKKRRREIRIAGALSDPAAFFATAFSVRPRLPPRPSPSPRFTRFSTQALEQFVEEQRLFELQANLTAALQSSGDKKAALIRKSLFDPAGVRASSDEDLIEWAIMFVQKEMSRRLLGISPRLTRGLMPMQIEAAWSCASLLQAMYLMLFLDIANPSVRSLLCENRKCHRWFYDNDERVRFCSSKCENREKALRYYHAAKKTTRTAKSKKTRPNR